MSEKKTFRVVVASPAEVSAERDLLTNILEELNRGVAGACGLRLELSRWETDAHPGFHADAPQGLIDPILKIADCDLLIGIFWKRIGTPTAGGKTGTEHEFATAYEGWKQNGHPQIFVYFNQKPHAPSFAGEIEQWGKTLKFREQFPKEGLWWPYKGETEFEKLVRSHLTNYIHSLHAGQTGQPRQPGRPDAGDQGAGAPETRGKAPDAAENPANSGSIELFYSYAPEDESFRIDLEKHLKPLQRAGAIAGWHQRKISAGADRETEIDQRLESAGIILLLISSDFLSSDYCFEHEMKRALERHEEGSARVIPVILRNCDWKSSVFGKLQALPKDAKPVKNWADQDEAWLDVASAIRLVVEEMKRTAGLSSPSIPNQGRRQSNEPIAEAEQSPASASRAVFPNQTPMTSYHDFDLQLSRSGRKYIAHVIRSDAGEAKEQFSLPFTEMEIENLLLKLRPSAGNRGPGAINETAAKEMGGGLYNAVFQGEVALRLASCIQLASRPRSKVRIRLRLDSAPELAGLPWEFLYDKSLNRFLSLSKETALVRYLDHPRSLEALNVSAPLKVLVMISSPKDLPPLDVEAEWQKMQQAFSQLALGLIEVHRLVQASLAELDQQLSRDQYHIFHYIGHGLFEEATGVSSLALEDPKGLSFEITGEKIGVHLQTHPSLRMVILNACEGARAATHDIYSGIAQGLIRCGVPAVIGMQFAITDQAATAFSGRFYDAIARGKPVDDSMDEARLAIHAAQNGGSEWGTPVLYLRAQGGALFNVTAPVNLPPAPGLTPVRPTIALPRAAPNGTLSPNSRFYIERAAEKRAVEFIQDPGVTLTIIKPGQSGGSSLVNRLLDVARQAGKRAAYLNFQRLFTNQDFADAETFFYRFCIALTRQLKIDDRVATHWESHRNLGIGDRCSYYLQYILEQLNGQSLLLAMDEIDRLANAPFKSDFFAMVRNWHNDRAMEPDYERLSLALITSLELHQLIDDHFQSPFNIGEVERLEDFSPAEVALLASRYGLQPGTGQIEKLTSWLGGHPYLHQLALHHLAKTGESIEALVQQARVFGSPFTSYLESVYIAVNGAPALLQGVKDLLHPRPLDEATILRLRLAGLVLRKGNKAQFRCRLFEEYLLEQFR